MPSIRSAKPADSRTHRQVIAAVAIQDTGATAALVDDRGHLLVEQRADYPRGLRFVSAGIARLLVEVGSSREREGNAVAAIGVSVPGYVNPEGDRVTIPKRAGWNRVALKETLAAEIAALKAQSVYTAQCPIVLSSRNAACVAGEGWTGAARGESDVVFVSIEDEIEAGLLVDGRVVRGSSGRAGAAGWFALSEAYRKEFEDSGCLSVEGGRRSVVRRTIEAWTDHKHSVVSRLSVTDAAELTPEMVIRAARGGDPLASQVVTDLCNWIGRGVADLISMLNPEVVVIGGDFGIALKPFLGDLRREARRWVEPGAGRQCRIVGASLGAKSALIGAARLAMQPRIQDNDRR